MTFNMITGQISPISCQVNTGVTVTAGDLVKTVTGNDVVTSSGVSSYATSDILIDISDASGDSVTTIGIAGSDGAAGDTIPVYTQGIFILQAVESITAGNLVQISALTSGTNAQKVADWDNTTANATQVPNIIGRSLTGSSADAKYLIVLLRT